MLATTGAVTLALVSILQLTEATRIPLTKRDVGIKQADGSINLAKLKEETSNLFGLVPTPESRLHWNRCLLIPNFLNSQQISKGE